MKIKTNELTGAALDWAVNEAQGCNTAPLIIYVGNGRKWLATNNGFTFDYSNWSQGGPIIESESIGLFKEGGQWVATQHEGSWLIESSGPTALIAAMRRYVASKLGDEVEIPKELT